MDEVIEGFNKVEKIRAYETVVEQFIRLITSGQIKPGDKLPTERDLADRLGISRSILREAFRVMESLGIVESYIGSGRYVRKADVDMFGLQKGQEHLALYLSFMEARSYIEIGTVALACTRARDQDLERILRAVEVDLDEQNFVQCDTEFHLSITIASHNPVLEWVMGSQLFSIYFTGAWDNRNTGRWKAIQEEHRKIYQAIRDRNSEVAKQALLDHLQKIKENILSPS